MSNTHVSAIQFRDLAEEGELYSKWFTIMAEIQEAVDHVSADGMDGLTCYEQAENLEDALLPLLRRLKAEGRKLDWEF